jgi:Probable cobalt transporter subunit (CbtA)
MTGIDVEYDDSGKVRVHDSCVTDANQPTVQEDWQQRAFGLAVALSELPLQLGRLLRRTDPFDRYSTALYFTFLLISVAAAAATCTVLAARLFDSRGVQGVLLIGAGTYVAVMVVASALMPTIDEIGDFPGDVLWDFRLASLFTLTALRATVTIVLTALIRRLHADHVKVRARGEPLRTASSRHVSSDAAPLRLGAWPGGELEGLSSP